MKIKKIFKDIPVREIRGSRDVEVTGVASHSQAIAPGNLFIARKGGEHDGMEFVEEAVQSGAVAVLTDMFNPALKNITQIIVPDTNALESEVAARVYGYPARELFIAAVTGTNGKTTSSFIIKHFVEHFIGSCGLIGTIEYQVGAHRYPAIRTTPDSCTLHKLLREMVASRIKACSLEVSSHALSQGRIDHLEVDVACFTNLSEEHLDYHKTLDAYADAKKHLFTLASTSVNKGYAKGAVINADAFYSKKMMSAYKGKILTYSVQGKGDLLARFTGKNSIEVSYRGRTYPAVFPFVGTFNLSNLLLALGTVITEGWDLREALEMLPSIPEIPGRLERVHTHLDIDVLVDYAHTEDALIRVLTALNEQRKGRLIVVFGCGGNRDKAKRPRMAAAVEKYADFAIVTNDNPRQENPERILQEIIQGFSKKAFFYVEPDRKEAIRKALGSAEKGDTVLIAGKGHETQQCFAHKTLFFDDRLVAREILEEIEDKALI